MTHYIFGARADDDRFSGHPTEGDALAIDDMRQLIRMVHTHNRELAEKIAQLRADRDIAVRALESAWASARQTDEEIGGLYPDIQRTGFFIAGVKRALLALGAEAEPATGPWPSDASYPADAPFEEKRDH